MNNILIIAFLLLWKKVEKKLFSAIVVFFISSSSEILRTQGFIEINCSIKKVLQNFLSVNEIQIFKYFQKIL